MSTFAQLVTVLEGVTGVKKVINDGRFKDNPTFGDRHLHNVPYIEIIESDTDLRDHNSSVRNRQVTATGRMVVMKERDNFKTMKANLESAFTDEDLFHLDITDYSEFSPRLDQLSFSVGYFATVAKS